MKQSHPLAERVAGAIAQIIMRRPGLVVVTVLSLIALSLWSASQLRLNTNQLDLIDQDLRQVQDVQRVVKMVGGAGHLILALRGSDEVRLKEAADELAKWLEADKERIHHLTYKIDTTFARERAGLFMESGDLVELRGRASAFLKDRVRRASPFFFEIEETQPLELEIDDLVAKYSKVGKRTITDDYWISDDKEMLLIVVKPNWNSTELDKTGVLISYLQEKFNSWPSERFKLVEDYDPEPSSDPTVVEYGFSGSYKLGYDDSYEVQKSLAPVSGIALLGVLAVLLIFFRSRVGAVALVLSGLVLGVIMSFGFAGVAVGELNMITSMLAGILMGLGIDFGIHLIYRLREELGAGAAPAEAVRLAIVHQGPASFVSAAGIGAAFLSLLLSEFKGFSQFGLLAGVGVFIIGLTIYFWVPAAFLLLDRLRPGLGAKLVGAQAAADSEADRARFKGPKRILTLSLGVTIALAVVAPKVSFDYNTRALSVTGQTSLLLHDEIAERFQISADPVAVYTPTAEAAKEVFEYFKREAETLDTIDQLVSIYSFIPPAEQQAANYKVAQDWKAELEALDPSILPEEYRGYWDQGMTLLDAKPYGLDDMPDYLVEQFHEDKFEDPYYQGWLTYIYPTVDLWDGRMIVRFAEQVENVPTESGEVYHAAGLPILYALLSQIVLSDGKTTMILTSLLLVLILLVDLRSLGSTLVALLPLLLGVAMMLGVMALLDVKLNFLNIVIFPIVLGYGVSHGVYLLHRFKEGASPRAALRSVGTAVACSTLTTLAGWAALLAAPHRGLSSMGVLACLGMAGTLIVSFTVMPSVLQLMDDRRQAKAQEAPSDAA